MKAAAAMAFTGLIVLASTIQAASAVERIRGTVEAVKAGSLTIRTIDGTSATVVLTTDTRVVSVVRSSLDAITDGVFVGTATKGDDPPRAPGRGTATGT